MSSAAATTTTTTTTTTTVKSTSRGENVTTINIKTTNTSANKLVEETIPTGKEHSKHTDVKESDWDDEEWVDCSKETEESDRERRREEEDYKRWVDLGSNEWKPSSSHVQQGFDHSADNFFNPRRKPNGGLNTNSRNCNGWTFID